MVEEENQFQQDIHSGQSTHSYTQNKETHFKKKKLLKEDNLTKRSFMKSLMKKTWMVSIS